MTNNEYTLVVIKPGFADKQAELLAKLADLKLRAAGRGTVQTGQQFINAFYSNVMENSEAAKTQITNYMTKEPPENMTFLILKGNNAIKRLSENKKRLRSELGERNLTENVFHSSGTVEEFGNNLVSLLMLRSLGGAKFENSGLMIATRIVGELLNPIKR